VRSRNKKVKLGNKTTPLNPTAKISEWQPRNAWIHVAFEDLQRATKDFI
jgi:hypothetical protein